MTDLKSNWLDGEEFFASDANNVAIKVNTHTADIAAAYVKPGGGIPSADLATAVQTLLTAAGSAVQPAAMTSAITTAVNNLLNGAPGALDTLKELADAINDDASFAATVTTALALKAPLASPAFTGTPTGITKTHVGLGLADNTSDINKPVSTAQAAAITAAVNGLLNGAPGALDTLKELADALGDDANFATTVTNALAARAPLMTVLNPLSASTAPTINKLNIYDASGGALRPPLPALSGLAVGATYPVQKAATDLTKNTVTFLPNGSDTFDSGATQFSLQEIGELRIFEVAATAVSTKYWKVVGGNTTLTSTDNRYVPLARSKVQVTDNCYMATATQAVGTASTDEFIFTVGVNACDIQLVFGNHTSPTGTPWKDVDPATSITFSAALRDAAGNVYAVTFGGQRTVALPGGGVVVADPLAIELTAGQQIFVRTYVSTGTYPSTRQCPTGSGGYGGTTVSTDLTATGAAAVTGAQKLTGWGPSAIIGTPTSPGVPKACIVQGDSISYGIDDGAYYLGAGFLLGKSYLSGGGYWMRALTGLAGVINTAISGDITSQFIIATGHFRRAKYANYARYALIGYGNNDMGSGGSVVATLQASILTLARQNLGRGIVKNIVQTITPGGATTTDHWATVGNQTASTATTNRSTYNDWVRDGGPIDATSGAAVATGTTSNAVRFGQVGHPIGGYVEVADSVESSRNSGKWKAAAGRVLTDVNATSGSTGFTSATGAFTSGDLGATVVIAGAGTAGADLLCTISAINSSTAVTIIPSIGTTVSGATAVFDPYTADGTHPCNKAHVAIAADIQTPLLAQLT